MYHAPVYNWRRQCTVCSQGGSDQGMPIIVSRVAPGTPADICIPRLNEGDQVLHINGRDVSTHKHEQVSQAYTLLGHVKQKAP